MPHHNEQSAKSQPRGELFLVATPIGNLKDISARALATLSAVDRIACEDTRTSGVLLQHYGIKAPLSSYHTHNEASATETLLAALTRGERIALISDAGTPLLSDPGERLVQAAINAGIRVTPIPGASALLSAITISGLPAAQFYYAGFLPTKATARASLLAPLLDLPATLVFYEAPHRLLGTLAYLETSFGNRPAAVARELTKLHEECVRGSLREIITHFETTAPRGECVIILAGAEPPAAMEEDALDDAIREALTTMRMKEAAAHVAKLSGRPKRDVYARALVLKGDAEE